jgi:hypothetical protein
MAEIKGNLRYIQIPLSYLRNTVAELLKNINFGTVYKST